MALEDCSLHLQLSSVDVDLSERTEHNQPKEDRYDNITLVEKNDNGDLYVSFDEKGVELTVRSYHVENEDTNRTFHADLRVHLSWKDTAQLARFLTFLPTIRLDDPSK